MSGWGGPKLYYLDSYAPDSYMQASKLSISFSSTESIFHYLPVFVFGFFFVFLVGEVGINSFKFLTSDSICYVTKYANDKSC